MPRRADEIAQNSNVGAVSADTPGVHRQTKTLGKVEIHTRIVEFRQAETLRRQHAIQASRVDRPWRAGTPPGPPRQLRSLLPTACFPGADFLLYLFTCTPFAKAFLSTCMLSPL